MSTKELTSKIRNLKELQALIEEAQAEAEAIKDELKSAMGDEEVIRAGEYKLTYKTVKSSRIDTTGFKKEFPDIARRYTIATEYKRFTVA